MATPVVARFRDPGAEAGSRRWVILLGIMAMAAAAILMFVGASLGTLYAAVLVLGVLRRGGHGRRADRSASSSSSARCSSAFPPFSPGTAG